MASTKYGLNGRRPQWKTTSMEDNLNGRQPQWKKTLMEWFRRESNQSGSIGPNAPPPPPPPDVALLLRKFISRHSSPYTA